MGVKSSFIKLTGSVDRFFSGLAYNPGGVLVSSALIGGVLGSVISFGTLVYKQSDVRDFSDDVDSAMQTYDDGVLMRFPENCGLDDDYYLISSKPTAGLEIGRGDYRFSQVKSVGNQHDTAEEISECMAVLSNWAAKDNFDFTDEFRHITNVEYTEAGLIHDLDTDGKWIYKDVLNVDEDDARSMHVLIQESDEYNEDGNNKHLYRAAFIEAAGSWDTYEKRSNELETYYKDGEIKNADKYAKYEYHSMSLDTWFKTMGGVGLAALFMVAGSAGARRSSSYDVRESKRQDKLSALKSLSGVDTPIL